MYCKECRKQIPDASKFCKYCGTPIIGEETSAEPQPMVASQASNPARCTNGHYYDSTKNRECPYCQKEYKELNDANVPKPSIPAHSIAEPKPPVVEQAEGKDIRTIRVLLVSMFALLDIAVGVFIFLLFI